MNDSGSFPVKLYVYDLTKGLAKSMSMAFLGKQIDGVWHTGTVVYGEEYYFGGTGGIESCPPCGTILGEPDTIIDMGTTQIPKEMFLEYLSQLATSNFKPQDYNLLEHNCNNFSDEVCQFLTGKSIPSHITGLPREVLNTPMGAMIKPLIDSMNIQPSGGHSVFPSEPPGNTTSTVPPSRPVQIPPASPQTSPVTNIQSPSQPPVQHNSHKPVTTKADIKFPVLKGDEIQGSIKSAFSLGDLNLWNEALEYLQTSNPSWSLSKNHIYVIGKILCSKEIKVKDLIWKSTCEVLQNLLLIDDVLPVIIHTSVNILHNILSLFDKSTLQHKVHLLPIIINLNGSRLMYNMLFGEKKDEILNSQCIKICCTGLLEDSQDSQAKLLYAKLAFNITTAQKDDDVDIEIGSALTSALEQQNIDNDTAICLLSSLIQIIKRNGQMKCLVVVMGCNWPHLDSLSQNCKELYKTVKTISSS